MGADLNNILKTQSLTDEHVQFLVYQILRGLKYIHSAGIIHRVSAGRVGCTRHTAPGRAQSQGTRPPTGYRYPTSDTGPA